MASASPVAAQSQSADVGHWLRHDETDPIDHTPVATAILPATGGTIGGLGRPTVLRKPILVIRCRQRELQVFVLFDRPVTGPGPSVRALYSFGGNPEAALLQTASDGSAYGAYSGNQSRPLLSHLLAAATFTIQTKADTGETSAGVFDLAGIGPALEPIRQACI